MVAGLRGGGDAHGGAPLRRRQPGGPDLPHRGHPGHAAAGDDPGQPREDALAVLRVPARGRGPQQAASPVRHQLRSARAPLVIFLNIYLFCCSTNSRHNGSRGRRGHRCRSWCRHRCGCKCSCSCSCSCCCCRYLEWGLVRVEATQQGHAAREDTGGRAGRVLGGPRCAQVWGRGPRPAQVPRVHRLREEFAGIFTLCPRFCG
mmetsp:Transcript_2987/g.6063  ORF Transcript_2987/g.6063 Transcript_2987/m.6063 type:complete len:203 (+) Transcript_2987:973-1581(+)